MQNPALKRHVESLQRTKRFRPFGRSTAFETALHAGGAAELDNVLSDIALHSPQGRHRVQGRIKAMIDLLLEHPRSGRFTNLRPVRRIATTPYPYVIFYEATEDEIIILGVRHGARDPSSLPAF